MLGLIAGIGGRLIDAGGTVVGYRHGTKEPDYLVEELTAGVEIRRYGVRIAAETTVLADEEVARSVGFRRLARYIFGGNHAETKIAMTAPVAQQTSADSQWVIRFFMPAETTLESLPQPDDAVVSLVPVPAETMAVRRFTGSRSGRAVAAQTAELLAALPEIGFEATGAPVAWFYDPPWTIPMLRRNEVAVPVKPTS